MLGFVQQNDGFFKERPLNSVDFKRKIIGRNVLVRIGHGDAVDMKTSLNDKARTFVTGSEPLGEKNLFSNHCKLKS